MENNVCIVQNIVVVIVLACVIAGETNIATTIPSIIKVDGSSPHNLPAEPSKLQTVQLQENEGPSRLSGLQKLLNNESKAEVLGPVESATPNAGQGHPSDYDTYSEPISVHSDTASVSKHQLSDVRTNRSAEQESATSQEMPKVSRYELPDNGARNVALIEMSKQSLPLVLNNTAGLSGRSGDMMAFQAANGAPLRGNNMSSADGGLNTTARIESSVLTPAFSSHEIELVIIAQKYPNDQQETTTEFPLSLPKPSQNRRFPSSILTAPNITLLPAPTLLHTVYAPRYRYWPVYLTMTLMCLCVVAICVVWCTSQGRRDMSGPPKQQYGQQLPPYNYAFSYDMRHAESEAPRVH